MMTRITRIACAALMFGAVACKKESKKTAEAPPPDTTAPKTTEPPPAPAPEGPKLDTAEQKISFYKDCYAAINAHDMDKYGKCLAEDVVSSEVDSGMPDAQGRAAAVDNMKNMVTAFPDMSVTPLLILNNGDKLASVGVFNGTHQGPMKGPMGDIPATNKKVGNYYLHVAELANGKGVAKEWLFSDTGTMLGQLGLSKAPHRAPIAKPTGEPTVAIAKDDDTEKANLAACDKGMEAFNAHDMKAMAAMWDPKAKVVDVTAPKDMDAKKMGAMMTELLKGVPDAKGETVDHWAAGDYVVAISKNSGTNKGPMPSMGIKKATNKSASFTEADVMKLQGGKVTESWGFYNGAAIAMQLGLMQPPKGADMGAAPAGGAAPEGGAAPDKAAGDKEAAPAKGKKGKKGAAEPPADEAK